MNAWGIPMTFCGGETADMGDTVRTIIVDAVLTVRMLKASLVANKIRPDQTIIALASGGSPATYETSWNSGIGSNGLTAARHELLQKSIAEKHPEVFDKNTSNDLIFKGPFGLHDSLPGSPTTALEALLSPTRTYAPVIASLLKNYSQHISGLVHCSGGGQLKCLRFGKAIVYHKTLPSEPPPIFTAIRAASGMSWGEMAKIFNLGYRFEIYCDPVISKDVIEIASRFNIAATEIGYTRKSADINNHLILTCESEEFRYSGKPWED
jgi:phosphoribosylformylglycinamidine cyclo-ligase